MPKRAVLEVLCEPCRAAFWHHYDLNEHLIPGHARSTDPDTSHATARSHRPDSPLTRTETEIVFTVFARLGPAMRDEILRRHCRRYGRFRGESNARKRRCDLVDIGLVMETTARERTRETNIRVIVWSLTDQACHLICPACLTCLNGNNDD